MSSRLVGHVLEHYPGSGGELVLAICLADEAAHSGGNIRAVVAEMARLSRQSEIHVRRLLRKMERAQWLQCVERSLGGKGKPSVYQINPEWVRLPVGFAFAKPEHNPNILTGFDGPKPEHFDRVSDATPSLFKSYSPPIPPQNSKQPNGCAVPSDVELEDERLSRWMLGKIREIHAGHREPNWKRWSREVRLLRTRDRRTHREIAELFAWANADRVPRSGDFCWATVVLSPAKLRLQWDKLVIARMQQTEKLGLAAREIDDRCAGQVNGARCALAGSIRIGQAYWCMDCYERRPVTALA
jgi:hypothetical protein